MEDFISEHQYAVAWGLYLVSAALFLSIWWRMTGWLGHNGWSDMLRGLALVGLFTPWFPGADYGYLAPASMIVAMEYLAGATGKGTSALLALIVATVLMLVILIFRRRKNQPWM